MPSTVQNISINYDAINEHNTFSNGDIISGRVILELSKETEINSLSVKAKGKAEVHWTERHNDRTDTYSAKEKYFKLEQFLLKKRKGDGDGHQSLLMDQCGETYGKVISAGTHVYPFTLQIPQGNMPSSFKGVHGKVIYTLEAKLDRSMRLDSKTISELNFHCKAEMSNPQIMSPQIGTQSKKMKLFTSGNASMNIRTEKMGYMQGEGITVTADIENGSSRALVTKFSLDQKQSFFARGKKRVCSKQIFKEEAEPVPSSSHQTITKVLKVPPDLATSIINCKILKVEYKLKVYLDVPYATDPEVKLKLIILSAAGGFSQMPQPGIQPLGFQSFGNTNQAGWNNYPPQIVPGAYPPQTAPGAYPPQTAPGAYPPQTIPGAYPPQTAPGGHPPQTTPGAYPHQTVPSAPPPHAAFGMYPN